HRLDLSLEYVHDTALRHHQTRKNATTGRMRPRPFRDFFPLIFPVTFTLRPFLAKQGLRPPPPTPSSAPSPSSTASAPPSIPTSTSTWSSSTASSLKNPTARSTSTRRA